MQSDVPTDGRTITYQYQPRKCNSAHCKRCRDGGAHGPYWYAYWHDDHWKLKSCYVGKEHPLALPEQLAQTIPPILP